MLSNNGCDTGETQREWMTLRPFLTLRLSVCSLECYVFKYDWHNRLSRDRLSATLMICEEGPDIEKFNPDVAISEWYDTKVRRLTSGPHNCPMKRKTSAEKSCVVDLAAMTLSDLEDLDSDEEQYITCKRHFDMKNNFEKKFFFCCVK